MEDDNSPITGMMPLGEQMVVFKQDSIWIMAYTGLNDYGLANYVPQRVVAGVGCVANASIQKIRGNLIFLAEDGIYAFDGTPNIEKLSDKVNHTIAQIPAGTRYLSAAGHWKAKNLYLLSVPTGTSTTRDTTIVYDYKNGTWWLWTGLNAGAWMSDEDGNDNEVICFTDENNDIMRMVPTPNDYGAAIPVSVTTHRFGLTSGTTKVVRQVEMVATNKAGTAVAVEPLVNDETTGLQAGTLDFTDPNDVGYERRRMRRMGFRRIGEWFQVKITHAIKNAKFSLSNLRIGYFNKGDR
jgi:hypothetical protein